MTDLVERAEKAEAKNKRLANALTTIQKRLMRFQHNYGVTVSIYSSDIDEWVNDLRNAQTSREESKQTTSTRCPVCGLLLADPPNPPLEG